MLLSLLELVGKYNLKIKGAIHVGAHFFEEKEIYNNLNIENIFLIEPSSKSARVIFDKICNDSTKLWVGAAGATAGFGLLNTEEKNEGQSNSLLRPLLHKKYYPDIEFNDAVFVKVDTLDYIIGANISSSYNFINCDVQGYELEVFKGATSLLRNNIQYIYCEVNREYLYENCALVEQIDEFLVKYNFKRVETKWTNQGWGDALYIKSNIN